MHGHHHASLRTPNTLRAFGRLDRRGLIPTSTGENLRKSTFFIRSWSTACAVRGTPGSRFCCHRTPDEFIFLARRVGYQTEDWQAGAKHLLSDIERHMKQNRVLREDVRKV